MLKIYEHDQIMGYFDQFPTDSLTVLCPGSGSWCETFDNRDHYIRRKNAYDEWTSYTKTLPTHQYDDEANRLMRVYMDNQGKHSNPWDHEEKRKEKAKDPNTKLNAAEYYLLYKLLRDIKTFKEKNEGSDRPIPAFIYRICDYDLDYLVDKMDRNMAASGGFYCGCCC